MRPSGALVRWSRAAARPSRIIVSPDGSVAWIAARESDQFPACSATALLSYPRRAGSAAVGQAPVGLALSGGRRILIADSKRSGHQVRMFTARATTSPRMTSEINACTPMVSLAQCRSGMTSVGLNAVAFVRPR